MRRISPRLALLFLLLAVASCQPLPGPEQAIQDFESTYEIRVDVRCTNPRIVAEYVKAPRVRYFGVQATCSYYGDPVAKDEYFKMEYAGLGGGWELRNVSPVSLSEIEGLSAREPVTLPPPGETCISDEALFPILVLVIPGVVGVVIFVIAVWLLRHRMKDQVDRPAGAGITVRSGDSKPGQRKSHWTINPLD